MELALVPLRAHGNFYEGDCYVILSVSTIPPSPLILTSSSPESQFQGFPGRSAHKVNQASGIRLDSSSLLHGTGFQFDYQRLCLGQGFKFCIRIGGVGVRPSV